MPFKIYNHLHDSYNQGSMNASSANNSCGHSLLYLVFLLLTYCSCACYHNTQLAYLLLVLACVVIVVIKVSPTLAVHIKQFDVTYFNNGRGKFVYKQFLLVVLCVVAVDIASVVSPLIQILPMT